MKFAGSLFVLLTMASAVHADDATVKAMAFGKALAKENCVACHAIEATGKSTLEAAPPFRDIAVNYDEGELEDAFNEGVATDHPVMPDWDMTSEQAAALAAYIMSLAPHGMKKTEAAPAERSVVLN
jgi:cytochrome c